MVCFTTFLFFCCLVFGVGTGGCMSGVVVGVASGQRKRRVYIYVYLSGSVYQDSIDFRYNKENHFGKKEKGVNIKFD